MIYRRRVFSLVTILFWFSLYAYIPQMGSYANEMGASYKLIGFITSAYGFSQTILRIPLGILSDKIRNRKVFILFGILCSLISATLIYVLPNPYTLLVGRLIAGIAAATWVNFTILFLSYFNSEETSKSIGIANANSKVGQLLAMLIGGFVAVKYGVRSIFSISIIMSLISLILGFFIYEEENEENTKISEKKPGILTVINNKRILHISFLGMIIQFIAYSTTFGFTPLIATKLGANNLELSYLSILYLIPQVIFSVLAGSFFAKKFGDKFTLLFGIVIITVLCIMTPFAPNLIVLYIFQMFSGIGMAITFPLLMSIVIKDVNKDLMTTAMGFYQAAYGVGMIVGPMILGSIADMYGLTAGFIVVGFLGLLSILSVLKIKE